MQKPKSTEENTERVQKPWLEINRKEFEELTGDIYNNQGNNDFKIIIKKTYDLKDAKKIWMEVTIHKTTKSEAKKLCNKLIQKDIDALEGEKRNDTRKYNILNILNNVGSIFTNLYFHYKDEPKRFEEVSQERIKLRKERFDEIKTKEQNMNNELFKA